MPRQASSVRRGLLGAVSLAVAATVALAGCGGIPTSGPVTVDRLVNDDVELELGFLPQGPRAGASQNEILQDFIAAATNPQNNYEVARDFLADGFAEDWDPNANTVIRSGIGTQRQTSEAGISYSITTAASVDSQGRYKESEPASQTQDYTFVRQGNQWRISSAPPGIVLSKDSFDDVFSEHALYYFDPTYQYLVPDVRWFPNRSSTSIRIVDSLLVAEASLLSGGVLVSAFPAGTALGEGLVNISSGIATVDLTAEARSASAIDRARMRQQLAASLGTVSGVVITVGGIPVAADSEMTSAVIDPFVEAAPLVLGEEGFGFVATNDITPVPQLSDKIVGLAPTGVTLARGKGAAAVRAAGGVYAVQRSGAAPILVDDRPNLTTPSIDNAGFIWSVPESNAAAIRVFETDGTPHDVVSNLSSEARVVSLAVSRDGARLLLFLATPLGAQLRVAGIVRQDGIPISLVETPQLILPAGQANASPVDATWVDNRTIATIATLDDETLITAIPIGGPTAPLGQLSGGAAIVGGNDGTDGLRVLTTDGDIFRPRGTSWQRTVEASLLATQQ